MYSTNLIIFTVFVYLTWVQLYKALYCFGNATLITYRSNVYQFSILSLIIYTSLYLTLFRKFTALYCFVKLKFTHLLSCCLYLLYLNYDDYTLLFIANNLLVNMIKVHYISTLQEFQFLINLVYTFFNRIMMTIHSCLFHIICL